MHDMAEEVMSAKTPSEAKDIAHRVPLHLHRDWHSIKVHAMRDILHAKATYCPLFKDELLKSVGKQIVESTRDLFWASGLNPQETTQTHPTYYPGRNKLGAVLELVRKELVAEAKNIRQLDVDRPDASQPTEPETRDPIVPTTMNTVTPDTPSTPQPPISPPQTMPQPQPDNRSTDSSSSQEHTAQPEKQNQSDDASVNSSISVSDAHTDAESDAESTHDSDMSGVEELPVTPEQSEPTQSESEDTEQAAPTESLPIDPPGSAASKAKPKSKPRHNERLPVPNQERQNTLPVIFERMKRKMTPGKSQDVTQDNMKMHKNDTKQ